jgi:Cyclin, N-terminal domain
LFFTKKNKSAEDINSIIISHWIRKTTHKKKTTDKQYKKQETLHTKDTIIMDSLLLLASLSSYCVDGSTIQSTEQQYNNDCCSNGDESSTDETLSILKRQEDMFYCTGTVNTATTQTSCDINTVSTTDARKHMLEWCYQVIEYCQLQKSTVEIAMSYMDRFVCTTDGQKCTNDINYYQIACMTCLYTAIKIHEPICLDPTFMSKLSQYIYTDDQFVQMECTILSALQYHMNPPTSYEFVQLYLQKLNVQQQSTKNNKNTKFDLLSNESIEYIQQKTYQHIQSIFMETSFTTCTMKPSIIAAKSLLATIQDM